LLFKKKEISYLKGKTSQRGMTLVPLSIYFKRGYAKLELALAKGKRQYDKRQQIIKDRQQREMERALKYRRRS
jgi:SsrA-binding protein